jgi:hypothetical protein
MISTTENTLRRSNFVLVPGVLYLASDSRTFWLSDDWGKARPAAQQAVVFKQLLEAEIPAAPTALFAAFLQNALDVLNTSEVPPAPRYPQVGDHCSGLVIWVQATLKQNWVDGTNVPYPIWVGQVQTDIGANGYSTPPANDEPPDFRFSFASTTPVGAGAAVRFVITQGRYAPFATIQEA